MPATTPNLALPYPVAADTADIPRDIQALAVKLDLSGAVATTLPASPTDGQECFLLADNTNGVVWHLRYRAASSNAWKWEFVGGAPMFHEIITNEGTSSTTYVDLATAGPQLTLPVAGDYEIGFAISAIVAANDSAAASPRFGTLATSDTYSARANGLPAAASMYTVGRTIRRNDLTAGSVIKVQYRTIAGAACSWQNRTMWIRPFRVG